MLENISSNKSFGGWHKRFKHKSNVLNCEMTFAVYLPPQASDKNKVPAVYWLSGLTCTDENFSHKAGAQRAAAELGIALIIPDTSPRGEGVADAPDKAYDLGLGAGFYVNATEGEWKKHYQMYDYIVKELPDLIEANFPINSQRAISGHSMGGHGALVIALRNLERYTSVSAFSPITNPTDCPWGQKALGEYLGSDKSKWAEYDASGLMRASKASIPTLVDQGLADDFLTTQLKPEALLAAAKESSYSLQLRQHEGYDHSYYFISTFIEEHLRFHAKYFSK